MRKILFAILLTGMLFTACSKDDDNSDKDSIEYFTANLRADLKYDDLVNLFGEPDADVGSGIHMYIYFLNDGTTVHIGYADKIIYARHVSSSGQVLHTII